MVVGAKKFGVVLYVIVGGGGGWFVCGILPQSKKMYTPRTTFCVFF